MVGQEARATTLVEARKSMNDFAPWEEWKKLCDSAQCSEETKSALYQFARINWDVHLGKEAGERKPPEKGEVTGREPWERFESYCVVPNPTNGKSWKDWLFMRLSLPSGTAADKIRSGASGIIRSVVREFLRKEGRFRLPRFAGPQPSLDDELPSDSNDGSLTLRDLLPDMRDPSKEAEFRELEQLAVAEAAEIMSELTERQRISITAKVLGLALSNPDVERIAGCKKSVLSDELDKTGPGIIAKIHEDYAEEDLRSRDEIVGQTLLAIREMCLHPKNEPEMWQSRLFSLAEEIEQ